MNALKNQKKAKAVRKSFQRNAKWVIAGLVAGAVSVWNAGLSALSGAASFAENRRNKKSNSKGENKMKKSTVMTLVVVLAAIAGALGALYFYVLRREKELDEYEQLLFSEDFNDEVPADFMNDSDNTDAEPEKIEEVAEDKDTTKTTAKTTKAAAKA